jgi:hypothetical protein
VRAVIGFSAKAKADSEWLSSPQHQMIVSNQLHVGEVHIDNSSPAGKYVADGVASLSHSWVDWRFGEAVRPVGAPGCCGPCLCIALNLCAYHTYGQSNEQCTR